MRAVLRGGKPSVLEPPKWQSPSGAAMNGRNTFPETFGRLTLRSMTSLVPSRTAVLASLGITAITVLILLAMDRPPICECGYVKMWHGQINDAGNSQLITD